MSSHEKETLALGAGAGLAGTIALESGPELGENVGVKARGYWEQVWLRFRRDKVAIAGGLFIIFLIIVAYLGAPLAAHLLGHGPDDQFGGGVDPTSFQPVGPWTRVSAAPYVGATGDFGTTLFILGADDVTGRDEFLRLLYGAQVSLEVAVGATAIGMVIGVLMGALGGYFGGWVDTIVSRLTEVVMAFPYLLFVIALASTVGNRLDNVTLGFLGKGVLTLILVLGLFSWFYPARIIRAQVLSLREKEFVEAARMVGASDLRIIRSHLLPHLVAPIIVYSTLVVAANILAEAGLSFLGLGIKLPTPSWGNLLAVGPKFYTTQPWLMVWPGIAVLITTLAFNLLGDGLRDAVDPRSTR
jgi:peptide/nickel transport system permease protein